MLVLRVMEFSGMHTQLDGNDSHSDTLLEPLRQDKDLNQNVYSIVPSHMQHHHSLHYLLHEYILAEVSFEADRHSLKLRVNEFYTLVKCKFWSETNIFVKLLKLKYILYQNLVNYTYFGKDPILLP